MLWHRASVQVAQYHFMPRLATPVHCCSAPLHDGIQPGLPYRIRDQWHRRHTQTRTMPNTMHNQPAFSVNVGISFFGPAPASGPSLAFAFPTLYSLLFLPSLVFSYETSPCLRSLLSSGPGLSLKLTIMSEDHVDTPILD